MEQRSLSTSDNSDLQNRAGLVYFCANRTHSLEEESEAESLDTTHSFQNSSDAALSDAETLVCRHHPELIEFEKDDSTLKEVPKLDGDMGSISDSSEDEEND